MSFKSALFTVAALVATANAHITLNTPVPYSQDKVILDPIKANGFPCQAAVQADGFKVTKMNKMAVGEQQTLSFNGGAVHNGGLCQLSVAMTTKPTKDTQFKVIKTIEGGCPGMDSQAKTFNFALPESIPNGEATFAWTWMPVSSGAAEYYMNCAPIEVSGGASDDSGFNALPDMLIANLEGMTTCKQVENTILKAPNPGSVVETGDTSKPLKEPTGECGATGSTPPTDGGSSSAAQPPASSAPAASSSPNDGQYTKPSAQPSAEPTVVPSNPGGIFAPSASSGAPSGAPSGSPKSTVTTLVTVTGGPSAPVPTVPAGTGSPAQPTAPPTSGGSTCSEDGAVVCNGETQFGLCNHGQVVWQEVAAGTVCKEGTIAKRGYHGRIARPRRGSKN